MNLKKNLINISFVQNGHVFQVSASYLTKTVPENIALPLQVKGISTKDSRSEPCPMVNLVELQAAKNKLFAPTLWWQQQRCRALHRSLAVEPDIWFLDGTILQP